MLQAAIELINSFFLKYTQRIILIYRHLIIKDW